jgi:ABC-type transport system involved in cytochrome c biogenesis permease component
MNKVFFVGQYIFLSLLFNIISLTFIIGDNNILDIGLILPISFIPLIILNSSELFIKSDMDDGTMTMLLTTLEPHDIILTKFLALCSIALIASLSIFPITGIIYSYSVIKFLPIITAQIFLIIQTSAFAILISTIRGYFRNNTNFLVTLILPLLIPSIIINGLILKNFNNEFVLASLGLIFIMVPICLIFSNYLVKNLYNY